MSMGLSEINRALNLIPKRAEQRQVEQLRETFLDSGVAVALETVDHQVIYGRRGTGKTHALRYFESEIRERGDVAIYADLRTIGSPDGLFEGDNARLADRASRLLTDLLKVVHDEILSAALEDDGLAADVNFVQRLDRLFDAISTVRIDGEVEQTSEVATGERQEGSSDLGVKVSKAPEVQLFARGASMQSHESRVGLKRSGAERVSINFADVARALRNLGESLQARRIWLLLDEWSSLPPELQPLLGEFLVRCVTPITKFSVKIAAIEQQTHFRDDLGGRVIGIELGADFSANVNLDEFMVYEQDEEKSIAFFKGLLFKHLTSGVDPKDRVPKLTNDYDLVPLGFTEKRAFEELVRAAEGVPRDAINIAAKAAMKAGSRTISINDVRSAAQTWFQSDKEAALQSNAAGPMLMNWIIDRVIRGKRARGFLVNQKSASSPLLLALFDARVLHLVRRGYSAQDEPGERYDVWVIDYGAYVDLIHTKYEPERLFPLDETGEGVEVPVQDLRAIRRAILDLDEFQATQMQATQMQ